MKNDTYYQKLNNSCYALAAFFFSIGFFSFFGFIDRFWNNGVESQVDKFTSFQIHVIGGFLMLVGLLCLIAGLLVKQIRLKIEQ
jgi:hypothetical protein